MGNSPGSTQDTVPDVIQECAFGYGSPLNSSFVHVLGGSESLNDGLGVNVHVKRE